jgi:hypothetical protein
VLEGLRLLEDDSLGGGGSRGSGRVRLANLKLTWRGKNYYASGAAQKDLGAGVDLAPCRPASRRPPSRSCTRSDESGTLIVKLRPAGPWRSGPDSGARNRVDPIYHSDSLYAAVTAAMSTLGMRDEWLDATARHPKDRPCASVPVFRFWARPLSSCRRAASGRPAAVAS